MFLTIYKNDLSTAEPRQLGLLKKYTLHTVYALSTNLYYSLKK